MRKESLLPTILIGFVLLSVNSKAAIEVEMILNNGGYLSYDHFKAELYMNNHDGRLPEAEIFGVLEIEGAYYFWPDFGTDVNYQTMEIAVGASYIPILEFDFPDIDDLVPYGPLKFWGAWYVSADRYGYDVAEFWLDSGHKWTPPPAVTNTPGPPTCTPAPTPSATPTPVPTNFSYIPPGMFRMGSSEDEMCRESNEGPVHTVRISHGFFIQSTEVTQQQWMEIFGNNPSFYPGMNRPVENITWYDCCVYCNRESQLEGLTPCYYSDASYTTVFDGTPPVREGLVYWKQDANGYRLPTEAEWEYACRARTTTAYSSGQENTDCVDDPNLDGLARYSWNGGISGQHAEVGSYDANDWGLYDMHGNAWEWCWDWYRWNYYSSSQKTDPTGPPVGAYRVLRGGAWNCDAWLCRSANRYYYYPGSRLDDKGFRLVRLVR